MDLLVIAYDINFFKHLPLDVQLGASLDRQLFFQNQICLAVLVVGRQKRTSVALADADHAVAV